MAYQDDQLDANGQPKKKLATVGALAPQDPNVLAQPAAPASTGLMGSSPTSDAKPLGVAPPVPTTAPTLNAAPTTSAAMSFPPPTNTSIAPAPPPPAPPAPPIPAPQPSPSLAPTAPPMSVADYSNYSPMTGKTDAEKIAIMMANVRQANPNATLDYSPFVATNDQTINPDGTATNTLNPQKVAEIEKLIGTVGQQGVKEQQAALASLNAGNQGINFEQALQDTQRNIDSMKGAGGVYSTPEDEMRARQELMRQSGFSTEGNGLYTWSGEPANNPNATPGMPEIKGVSPQQQPTGPAEYIIGGKVYDNPQGTGTPIRSMSPSAPTQNTAPGGATAAATSVPGNPASGGPYTPSMTTFTEDNNLRDKQINPDTENRGDIAQKYLDAFDTRAEPMLRDKLRSVGQRAASLGRLGMGDTAVEALNPYTDYLKERAALSLTLAGDSATGEITDRLNSRNELRGERSYQDQLNRQAIEDAVRQYQLGEQAKNAEFGRNATTAGFLQNAGTTAGNNAALDFNTIASLLAPFLYKQKAA